MLESGISGIWYSILFYKLYSALPLYNDAKHPLYLMYAECVPFLRETMRVREMH